MRFVKNEWIKIWAQKNSWIMVLIVIFGIVGLLGLNKYFDIDQSTSELRQEANNKSLIQYKELQNSQGLSEEDVQYFNEQILITEYRIANDLPAEGAVMFHDVVNQLLIFILMIVGVITMVIAASTVSNEFGTGTIKMLLTRPAARWKILLSKLIASLLYGATIFILGTAVGITASFILFNTDSVISLSVINGQVVEQIVETHYMEKIILNSASIFMTILFAFMLGTIFNSSTLAVSVSLVLLLLGSAITMFIAKYDFARYIWFANDLSQFEPGMMPIIEGLTLNFAIVVNIIYAIIFLAVSFTYFTRRDVTA